MMVSLAKDYMMVSLAKPRAFLCGACSKEGSSATRGRPIAMLALALLLIPACASKKYLTLRHIHNQADIAPASLHGVIHVKDMTYTGEGYDHVVMINRSGSRLRHVESFIWQPDAVEKITSMLRER